MTFFPFLQVPKVYTSSGYGMDTQFEDENLLHADAQTYTYTDQIPDKSAIDNLRIPDIAFDQDATAAREALVNDLIGDIIPIRMTGISI